MTAVPAITADREPLKLYGRNWRPLLSELVRLLTLTQQDVITP
jgi:hypothetical protein